MDWSPFCHENQAQPVRDLADAVRAALEDGSATVIEGRVIATHVGHSHKTARLECTIARGGQYETMRLIHKSRSTRDPASLRAEFDFYSSEFAKEAPCVIGVPKVYGATYRGGLLSGIFLEDLSDKGAAVKDGDDYALVAGALAKFNTHFDIGYGRPAWIRQWRPIASHVEIQSKSPSTSIRSSVWRTVTEAERRRERLEVMYSTAPQCLSHNDATVNNMLATTFPRRVWLFDWEQVGLSCVGSDLAALIGGSAFLGSTPLRGQATEHAVDLYCNEVARSGFGGVRQAMNGYAVCTALRCLRRARLVQALARDADMRRWWSERYSESVDSVFGRFDAYADEQLDHAMRLDWKRSG